MNPTPKYEKGPKKYIPKKAIREYMRQRVRFEPKHIEMEKRGENVTKDRTYQNLKQKKRRMLDTVFQSMANLLFFCYSIRGPTGTEEEKGFEVRRRIRESFEDDIKDLLGVRRANPDKESYAFIFDELIHSLVYTGGRDLDKDDFRLGLIHILQKNVFHKSQVPLSDHFSNPAYSVVLHDISRALAWTEMLVRGIDNQKSPPPSRVFDFSDY